MRGGEAMDTKQNWRQLRKACSELENCEANLDDANCNLLSAAKRIERLTKEIEACLSEKGNSTA